MAVGLDFGTTNSVLALRQPDGSVKSFTYEIEAEQFEVFRSLLLIEAGEKSDPEISAGPWALKNHLAGGGEGRLIQSVKSYLASPNFTETRLYGKSFRLEELIALIVRRMREAAEAEVGPLGHSIVCGRPVQFVGDAEQNDFAQSRLRGALALAGFTEVRFAYEPMGAAYHYCRRLEGPETLLIADFGGGTSDFSLLRVAKEGGGVRAEPLGVGGIGIAGDALDTEILRQVICPALGEGTLYRAFDKALPVPVWLYRHLERWHLLSMLNTPKTLRLIDELVAHSEAPRRLAALRHVIAANLGFALNRAVSAAKATLSRDEDADLVFQAGEVTITKRLTRSAFEDWIRPELAAMGGALDRLVADSNLSPGTIDRVFMTGGTSLVPAVRRLFAERFGEDKLVFGDELLSVAKGLALIAAEDQ